MMTLWTLKKEEEVCITKWSGKYWVKKRKLSGYGREMWWKARVESRAKTIKHNLFKKNEKICLLSSTVIQQFMNKKNMINWCLKNIFRKREDTQKARVFTTFLIYA